MFLKHLILPVLDLCLVLLLIGLAKNIISIDSIYIETTPEHTKTELLKVPTLPLSEVLGLTSLSEPQKQKSAQNFPNNTLTLLKLINSERISQNLSPLTLDANLTTVAKQHSEDMSLKNFFSHIDPTGKDPYARLSEKNINFQTAGENIAYAPNLTIAHANLMASKEHRDNILNANFNKIGIGIYQENSSKILFTEVFTN